MAAEIISLADRHVRRILDKDMQGMLPPHNLAAEAAVLSQELVDGHEAIDKVRDILLDDGSDFYSDPNRYLHEAAVALRLSDSAVDAVTVVAWLRMKGTLDRVGGPSYVAHILNNIPDTGAHLRAHAEIVRAHKIAREQLAALHVARAEIYGGEGITVDYLRALPERFAAIAQRLESNRTAVSIGEVFERAAIAEATPEAAKLPPLLTRIREIDTQSTGLHGGEWTLLGARTSDGKSTLAMTIAHNVAQELDENGNYRNGVLIFSTESGMEPEVYATRVACMRAGLDGERFRAGTANEQEKVDLAIAKEQLRALPIYFERHECGAMSQAAMQAKVLLACEWMERKGIKLRLIVIDLLSGLNARGEGLPRNPTDEQKLRYLSERMDAMMTHKALRCVHALTTIQIDEKEEYPKNCKALRDTVPAYWILRRKKPTREDAAYGREPAEVYFWKKRHGKRFVTANFYFYEQGAYFAD